jgi:hypothetical protein
MSRTESKALANDLRVLLTETAKKQVKDVMEEAPIDLVEMLNTTRRFSLNMIEERAMIAEPKQVETGIMKAIVRDRFGSPDVLQLKEIARPAPDGVRGVLVKVYASSVNPADRYDVNGMSFPLRLVLPLFRMGVGVRRPKEPQVGTDIAGTVEAVHSNVTQFKPGDEVYGAGFHGYAEYAGKQNSPQTKESVIRGICRGPHRRIHSTTGSTQPRTHPTRTEGID